MCDWLCPCPALSGCRKSLPMGARCLVNRSSPLRYLCTGEVARKLQTSTGTICRFFMISPPTARKSCSWKAETPPTAQRIGRSTCVKRTHHRPRCRSGKDIRPRFPPDGNWAMIAPRANPSQLVAVPVHAGDPRPLTADRIHHLYGRWLPDGRRIVFVGSEPGHGPRYYVQDSREAGPKPISGEGIAFDRSLDDIV